MADPLQAPGMDDFHAAVVARINAMAGGTLTLRCVRHPDGHIEPPRGATLTLSFTFAELRAIGVNVQIADADGNPLTDDAYAALLVAIDQAAAGVTPLAAV